MSPDHAPFAVQEFAFEDDHVIVTSVPVTTDEEDRLMMTGAGFDGAEGVELPPPPPPPPQLASINDEVRIYIKGFH